MKKLNNSRCFSINEWKEFYKKKTGDEFKTRVGFKELYLPRRGLCQICVTDQMVIVEQVSGDGKFWKEIAELIAQMLGLDVIGTLLTRRNPEAYMRLFGYEITEIDARDGEKRYFGLNKETGTRCVLTPAEQKSSKGARIYFVTCEVKKNAFDKGDNETNSSGNSRRRHDNVRRFANNRRDQPRTSIYPSSDNGARAGDIDGRAEGNIGIWGK